PFFAPSASPDHVCLVLFMDSEQEDFFSKEILETVFAASAGFVRNLDERAKSGDIRFATRSFGGYKAELRPEDQQLLQQYRHTLEVHGDGEFEQVVKKLTFQRVRSFDAELQLPRLGRQPQTTSRSPA